MALAHLIRHALAMPPREAAAKALRYAGRTLGNRLLGRLMRNQCSYPALSGDAAVLTPRLTAIDPAMLAANGPALRTLAADVRAHRFDLLGSGPVSVAHGVAARGFGSHRYTARPLPAGDWRDAVATGHWHGNRLRSRAVLALIGDAAYEPIDWHRDVISGYRWSPRTFGTAVPYGHLPGVDIKVPWELARLQHLPPLALAYGLDGDPRLVAEFRHQVLDFLGANPPGWGVNWACAMDVAIRAANMLLAWDLFRAHGAVFDTAFDQELAAALLAHARHIAARLEWNDAHRGNHYLADICGLAWIAAYLPQTAESDIFLVFATRQLAAEIERQFGADGANFEASTAYHRLSAEMAVYSVALILGLPAARRAAFADYDHKLWRRHPPLEPAPLVWPPFSRDALDRLAGAACFAVDVTKPSGEMVQVGDNDSGRFFTLTPGLPGLDPRHLVAAAQGLFDLDLTAPAEAAVETLVVGQLAGGARHAAPARPATALDAVVEAATPASHMTRVILPSDALRDLRAIAYPDFGLFIWRNARAFVSVRCGAIGQNGNGGHAHNDQLAVEIEIDGVPWARDPGTFVYTPDLAARNAYRSALAHFVPRLSDAEPARLMAPFRLEDRARARAVRFDGQGFLGCHQGFGQPVWRRVRLGDGALVIEDGIGGAGIGPATQISEHCLTAPDQLAALWGLTLPFSPGYGVRSA